MAVRPFLRVLVLLPLAACIGGKPAVTTAIPRHDSMRLAVAAAWRSVDSALIARDTARLGAFFSDDAVLVTASSDSIRGRSGIIRFLTDSLRSRPALSARFTREKSLIECLDWAVEQGDLRLWRTGESDLDGFVTPLGLRWTRDPGGEAARVSWLTVDRTAARQAARRARCPTTADVVRSRQRRFVVSMAPDHLGTVRADNSFEAVNDRVDAKFGLSPSGTVGTRETERTRGKLLSVLSLAGLRYRSPSRFGIEAFVIDQDAERYRATEASFRALYIDYRKTGLATGALVNYERTWLRVGVGPAYATSTWRMTQKIYVLGRPFERTTQTVNMFGQAAQLGVALPVGGRFGLEGRAQYYRFPRATIRGTSEFGDVRYDPSGYTVLFGAGVHF